MNVENTVNFFQFMPYNYVIIKVGNGKNEALKNRRNIKCSFLFRRMLFWPDSVDGACGIRGNSRTRLGEAILLEEGASMRRAVMQALCRKYLLLGWVGLLYAPTVSAQENSVSFCFNEWPPYVSVVNGTPSGVSVDVLTAAAKRAGLKASFTALPWKRCLQAVMSGEIDAVMDAAKRDEFLQGDVTFSLYTNTFWVRADERSEHIDLKNLGTRSIGLVAGYNYGETLDRLLAASGIKKDYSKDDPVNIRKLAFGRVDVIIADYLSTMDFAKKNDLSIVPLLPSHSFDRLYPSFNKNKSDLHKRINSALRAMIADGTIDAIYKRLVGVSYSDFAPSSLR